MEKYLPVAGTNRSLQMIFIDDQDLIPPLTEVRQDEEVGDKPSSETRKLIWSLDLGGRGRYIGSGMLFLSVESTQI